MTDYECPDCGGGFPAADADGACPWCGETMAGGESDDSRRQRIPDGLRESQPVRDILEDGDEDGYTPGFEPYRPGTQPITRDWDSGIRITASGGTTRNTTPDIRRSVREMMSGGASTTSGGEFR